MKPFSNIELSSFCGQTALILKSGISVTEGLTIMLEDAASPEEKEVLESLLESVQETGQLYQAMENTKIYPSYMIHMVQIGEETGTLDEVMESLRNHYEREDSISKSIRNSITYPMIMTGMMAVVIVVLLVKVMPIFNQVFIQHGDDGIFPGADGHGNHHQPLRRRVHRPSRTHRGSCHLRHAHGQWTGDGTKTRIQTSFHAGHLRGTGGLPVRQRDGAHP